MSKFRQREEGKRKEGRKPLGWRQRGGKEVEQEEASLVSPYLSCPGHCPVGTLTVLDSPQCKRGSMLACIHAGTPLPWTAWHRDQPGGNSWEFLGVSGAESSTVNETGAGVAGIQREAQEHKNSNHTGSSGSRAGDFIADMQEESSCSTKICLYTNFL